MRGRAIDECCHGNSGASCGGRACQAVSCIAERHPASRQAFNLGGPGRVGWVANLPALAEQVLEARPIEATVPRAPLGQRYPDNDLTRRDRLRATNVELRDELARAHRSPLPIVPSVPPPFDLDAMLNVESWPGALIAQVVGDGHLVRRSVVAVAGRRLVLTVYEDARLPLTLGGLACLTRNRHCRHGLLFGNDERRVALRSRVPRLGLPSAYLEKGENGQHDGRHEDTRATDGGEPVRKLRRIGRENEYSNHAGNTGLIGVSTSTRADVGITDEVSGQIRTELHDERPENSPVGGFEQPAPQRLRDVFACDACPDPRRSKALAHLHVYLRCVRCVPAR